VPSNSKSVLSHIIAILDCFASDHPELGVREVARLTGLSSSTAGRLMAEMKDRSILQQNSAMRTYSLGSKILVWSGVYVDSLDLRSAALPWMEELRTTTGETVTLYLLDGKDRLCIERMESRQNVRMVSRVGHKMPLYAGSAGKAILAFLPDERVREILSMTDLKPLTLRTLIDPDALRVELVKVRQQGYAVSIGEWVLEASGVAAPIFRQGGEVVGALSISGPGARFTPEKIEEYAVSVVQTVKQISRLLGFSGSAHDLK
jgi:DNA-binding IclR family transcriptional regulator